MTENLSMVSARVVKGNNPTGPIPWQVGILSRRKNATQKQGSQIVFEPDKKDLRETQNGNWKVPRSNRSSVH